MKTYNDNNILNLIEQIGKVNNMIDLHKSQSDEFMINQYKARQKDYFKELVYELICLDVNTPKLFGIVKYLISKIEQETPKKNEDKTNFI